MTPHNLTRPKATCRCDDGVVAVGPPYEVGLDNWWTFYPEPIHNHVVVVWYGAHFTHEIAHHAGHVVGPELQPVNW
jgi:hypothetical protein